MVRLRRSNKWASRRALRSYERAGSLNKYHAKKVTLDGHTFPSHAEAARYLELQLLERAGQISGLELQPKFKLKVKGTIIGTYIADFRYTENGQVIVEDVKGMKTPVYNLKKKLLKAIYGITILETRKE